MDVAARPSGHKRGLSAYDSQLASFDPSGKVARPSEAEAPEGDAEQQEQQHEEQPLTESAAFHLRTLRDMQANVVEQIDNLQVAGLTFLDQMRAAFLERINTVKQELAQGLDNVESSLRANSATTLENRKRAAMAGELVERLGLRTQDTAAPPDLFTAPEQEAEVAEVPAAE